jgi:hypothetical protein
VAKKYDSTMLDGSGPQLGRNHHWFVRLRLTDSFHRCHTFPVTQCTDLFRQPAASRIDDASRSCVEMNPRAQRSSACKKQVASPVCLSQDGRGLDPCDSKRCNPVLPSSIVGRIGVKVYAAVGYGQVWSQ